MPRIPSLLMSILGGLAVVAAAPRQVAVVGAQAPAAAARPSPFVPPDPMTFDDHDGWTSIFDGGSLAGWDGNPQVWSVEDGAITAASTPERRVGSTHLIWRGGEPSDFELKLEFKLEGDIHSGIAYRSSSTPLAAAPARQAVAGPGRAAGPNGGRAATTLAVPADPRWTLYGPGLDYDADLTMAGNVEERGTNRREIAWRGGIVQTRAGRRPRLLGSLGDPDALKAVLRVDDWNDVHIIARGSQITHIINGHVMCVLLDEDPAFFRAAGLIGLQIEQFGFGRVRARNIWIRS